MTATEKYDDSVNYREGRRIAQHDSKGHERKSDTDLGKRVA